MKRIFWTLAILTLLWSRAEIPPTSAHELLPEDILELIRNNPDITPEELDLYLEEQGPSSTSGATLGRDKDLSLMSIIGNYVHLGIIHILEGLDHVLFVLSLLLVFVNFREILKLITAFTIAHSLTFLLGGTGFFTLSSRIVEPLIALSIAYVAITTVFFKKYPWLGTGKNKMLTVFFFGLFHGLGFAGLLADLHIPEGNFLASLISFNVGIEIGQLIIIALALPLIYLFRGKTWYPHLMKIVAILISTLALYWVVERVFF